LKSTLFKLTILIFLSSCSSYYQITDEKSNLQKVDASTIEEDSDINFLIKPYKYQLEKQMGEVLGEAAVELPKGRPESLLTNFLADAILDYTLTQTEEEIDICVLNYGGIRLPSLSQGDITKGAIYELLPFDNFLAILELDVPTITAFFNHIAVKEGFPVSKNVHFTMDTINNKALDITVNGNPLQGTYKVLVPDYIANGGDQCAMLKPIPQNNLGIFLRDAMIGYLKSNKQPVSPILDGRLQFYAQ